MQRIAALVLCATLWSSGASAQTCATIGNIIGGFTGGATGYGLVRNIGPASNWISCRDSMVQAWQSVRWEAPG